MMKREEPRFSEDEEAAPLMTKVELRDACLYAAAIVVVAFSLGCEFEDCRLDDDGAVWPTATTRIEIKYPDDWRWKWGIFPIVGAIHETGAAAVAKQHDTGLCRINAYTTPRTSNLLEDPKIWATIKALATLIQDSGPCDGLLRRPGDGLPRTRRRLRSDRVDEEHGRPPRLWLENHAP